MDSFGPSHVHRSFTLCWLYLYHSRLAAWQFGDVRCESGCSVRVPRSRTWDSNNVLGGEVAGFDVVAVGDLRAGSPVVDRIADALADWEGHGSRTALVQLSRGADEAVRPLAPRIRQHVDRGQAELVLPHERVRAPVAVVWRPEDLPSAALPAIEAQRVIVVSSESGASRYGSAPEGWFGAAPEWHSVPPTGAEVVGAAVTGRGSGSATVSTPVASGQRTVLMVSSNGIGMGHLTRLLAYSRSAPSNLRPYFLSLSQAVPVVGEFGFPYEYVPSVAPTGMAPPRWRPFLAHRLGEAIERLRPTAVVFDGTWPYDALADARDMFPDVRWIWSRRGMWYRGMNRDQLAKAAWFDTVIEPGDFSSPADHGVTAAAPATRVGPVTLLNDHELLSRADARRALGLDADVPTALVTLGAGNINDATSDLRIVIDALRALGLEICVTVPAIADRSGTDDEHVHLVTTYPLARHLRAFDVAVSASGYNSFHELLRFGVPTLFLPNLETSLDDQRARARYAADQGWAQCLDKAESTSTVGLALEALLSEGLAMVAGVHEIDPGNGAAEAMEAIASHVQEVR